MLKKSHERTGVTKANRELTAAALRILEQSSLPAFTAATYGRLTGKPGVCISTLGPGMLHFYFISTVLS